MREHVCEHLHQRPLGAGRARNKHLAQQQLARRWALSEHTLERWRCTGEGPTYIKLGGLVRYRLADILAYEQENLCQRRPTNGCDRPQGRVNRHFPTAHR